MIRLEYSRDTQELLENIDNSYYWRYQESCFNGLIPQNHKSHERLYSEEPQHVESGVSCYDNPYQLLEYISNQFNRFDEDAADGIDVVIFTGEHTGTYGMDDEDIVECNEVLYSLSLWNFWEFCKNIDEDKYYLGCYNLSELASRGFED